MKQEIKLTINNSENVGIIDERKLSKIQEIFTALVSSGGLTGVKGGQTIIHFNGEGDFMGVQISYWPWKKRKNT